MSQHQHVDCFLDRYCTPKNWVKPGHIQHFQEPKVAVKTPMVGWLGVYFTWGYKPKRWGPHLLLERRHFCWRHVFMSHQLSLVRESSPMFTTYLEIYPTNEWYWISKSSANKNNNPYLPRIKHQPAWLPNLPTSQRNTSQIPFPACHVVRCESLLRCQLFNLISGWLWAPCRSWGCWLVVVVDVDLDLATRCSIRVGWVANRKLQQELADKTPIRPTFKL